MKNLRSESLCFLLLQGLGSESVMAQFGNPYGNRLGRQRGRPQRQPQHTPKAPEPQTAEEIVDGRMPIIVEAIGLDPFEEAVVRSTLVKHVQQKIELQILNLEQDKMREELEKVNKSQNAELEAGLPAEKFAAYMEFQDDGFRAKRKKKKKKSKEGKKVKKSSIC